MAYLPCGTGGMACWGQQSYINAQMLPQFDECYQARGGLANTYPDCTNGYPNKEGYWYESINSPASAKMTLKANLGGAYDTTSGTMRNNLRANNYLPTNQPYNVWPWYYAGNQTYSPSASNTNNVDWVLLEIRGWNSGNVIERKAAMMDAYGYVYESNGSQLAFANITSYGAYKVILRHRNHIAVSTSVAIGLTPTTTANLDFTNNGFITSANQKQLSNNVYGMYPGDATSDGSVSASDRNAVRNAQVAVGYFNNDIDIDGSISAGDRSMVRNAQAVTESI
jgi:hypothetical protein